MEEIDLPNDHLHYAITWFALAFGLLVVYVLFHRQQMRETSPEMSNAYTELEARFRRLSLLSRSIGMLRWDMSVMMPPGVPRHEPNKLPP